MSRRGRGSVREGAGYAFRSACHVSSDVQAACDDQGGVVEVATIDVMYRGIYK